MAEFYKDGETLMVRLKNADPFNTPVRPATDEDKEAYPVEWATFSAPPKKAKKAKK